MKKEELRRYSPLLEFMNGLSEKERHKYIIQAPKPFIIFLCDLCYNILLGNLNLSHKTLLKLKPKKTLIEHLCNKGISLKQRRKILEKKNFFSDIISPIIPELLNYL